jgi:hypothetical protein
LANFQYELPRLPAVYWFLEMELIEVGLKAFGNQAGYERWLQMYERTRRPGVQMEVVDDGRRALPSLNVAWRVLDGHVPGDTKGTRK